MVCVRPQPGGLKQLPRPRRSITARAHVVRRARAVAVSEPSRRLGEHADLAVAQAVVDEREKFAGGGDAADVATTLSRHPQVGGFDGGPAVIAGTGFDRRPPHEMVALLGDVAALDL